MVIIHTYCLFLKAEVNSVSGKLYCHKPVILKLLWIITGVLISISNIIIDKWEDILAVKTFHLFLFILVLYEFNEVFDIALITTKPYILVSAIPTPIRTKNSLVLKIFYKEVHVISLASQLKQPGLI